MTRAGPLFPLALLLSLLVATASTAHGPAAYDVVWNSPSADASGSMPLGNGEVSVNAWVDTDGDLVFYVGRTDSWGDNGRLLKVGRIRVVLEPPLPLPDGIFRQTLRLRDATMEVRIGAGEETTIIAIWVDAHHPIVHVTVDGSTRRAATVLLEPWRTTRHELGTIEVSDVLLDRSRPNSMHAPTVVEPDELLADETERIGWFHRNVKSVGPRLTARVQGVADFEREDPLLGRTFGGIVIGDGMRRLDARRLIGERTRTQHLSVYVHTEPPGPPERWLERVDEIIAETETRSWSELRAKHEETWADLWQRSWIDVTPREGVSATRRDDDAFVVSRAYALQRFIDACAGNGRYPIKFNGSTFTVPHAGAPGDADYRRWGPGYWWQNTRLPYLSMCTSGDAELMRPLFRMYAEELMPLFVHRTALYFGHDGAFIPECVYFWGDVFSESYGWTPFEDRGADKLQVSGWHKWEWVSGLELVWMMLDYYEHTLDDAFLATTLLPAAHELLTFFDRHYELDDDGRLVMHPAQALETWWDCTNPMPEVAGLRTVTARLLLLAPERTTDDRRAFWRSLAAKVPPLPLRVVDGVSMLAPAEQFADKRNIENPELYAVFPFRLVSFEKPLAAEGRAALERRWDRGNSGWRQDELFMASLGLADEARRNLVGRARNPHDGSRFPAFWGPNYDWVPDQTHGGVLMRTLQLMLMQTDGRTIHLLPAWPEDWDVSFRLHAPFRTVVEGAFRDGVLHELVVTPRSRAADVIVHDPQ